MRVRVFHNNARDPEGRHIAWDRGYLPGDTVTEVFAYDVMPDDPSVLEHAFDLFNVGDDPNYGKPDARALDYRARFNRSLSKGDVIALDDAGVCTASWFACAAGGWTEIDPPTVANAFDHGTTPIDATQEQITARRIATSIVDQAESIFAGQLRLVALAGYPISGGMFDLRDATENRLLDFAREVAFAQAAWRLTRRGKQVPGPDGEPATEEHWEQQSIATATALVEAVAAVKAATAHTN